jgi:competence protein ComEA
MVLAFLTPFPQRCPEASVNPFLHTTVASVQAPPSRLVAFPRRRAQRSRWSGTLRSFALAAGLSFAGTPAVALDVNTATLEQLRSVRGVGHKTAETIVKERERGGRFESMEDLSDRVRGIGMRRTEALEAAGLRVEGAPAAGGVHPSRAAVGRSPGPSSGPSLKPAQDPGSGAAPSRAQKAGRDARPGRPPLQGAPR